MLRRTFLTCVALLSATLCAAQDPFAGKWRLNENKSHLTGHTFHIKDSGANRYQITFTDGNSASVIADGTDQPYFRGGTISMKQLDDYAWRVVRKRATTGDWRMTTSSDGNTLTVVQNETLANGKTVRLASKWRRVGAGKGLVGDWESESASMSSSPEMQIQEFGANGLSFIYPAYKYRLDLKFDGTECVEHGPDVNEGSTTSGKRIDSHALELVSKEKGKPVDRSDYKLSSDGRTLTITSVSLAEHSDNKPTLAVWDRQ